MEGAFRPGLRALCLAPLPGPSVEGSKFCGPHAELFKRVRAELEAGLHLRDPRRHGTCGVESCKLDHVPGRAYCARHDGDDDLGPEMTDEGDP